MTLDAIDIDENGELGTPITKMIIKNQTTNNHYSLSDDILIHLPEASDDVIILHGIEKNKEIRLDDLFNNINYINGNSSIGDNKRIFIQEIEKSNTINIKEIK